jgi:hypothetical protein
MMPGIPTFRKESHPERAKDKRRPIYSHLLGDSFRRFNLVDNPN